VAANICWGSPFSLVLVAPPAPPSVLMKGKTASPLDAEIHLFRERADIVGIDESLAIGIRVYACAKGF